MLISYNWLKELINFPYSPEELSKILTAQGMTVDSLEQSGVSYDNVVVGKILEVEKHPDADKLSVCKVDVGDEVLQIVCGAPGVAAGQTVPVAKIGATLGDLKIKKGKLRGVESNGMCCAADELQISDDHETLLYLDDSLKAGTPLSELVDGLDYIFELDIASNRPDLLNHIGVAREIAARLSLDNNSADSFHLPEIQLNETDEETKNKVKVSILDEKLCPRYTARLIENVKIKPAPLWMQARLHRLGMRPINNIVDITNYVLLEYGHPLHAFDFSKISDGEIIVRRAQNDEKIVTLDDVERKLDEEILLIADKEKAVALAGVMGGANSEVSENTQTILLESAYFNGPNIRKTAKRLALQSESSYRFERGVSGMITAASNRATQLISELAEGKPLKGIVDVNNCPPQKTFDVDYKKCVSLLGLDIPIDKGEKILASLDFSLVKENDSKIKITVPEHRVDVEQTSDISEELARMVGYNTIPSDTKAVFKSEKPLAKISKCRQLIREILAGAGLLEAYNPSLVSVDLIKSAGIPEGAPELDVIELRNASTIDQSVMRPLLFPGLLRNLRHNISRKANYVSLFEIGRTYTKTDTPGEFNEEEKLGIILWGDALEKSWRENEKNFDFFSGTGIIELLTKKLGIKKMEMKPAKIDACHPGRTAEIYINKNTKIGWLAELNPKVARELDITGRVVLAEIKIAELTNAWQQKRKYKPLPKFPESARDIAFLISENSSHADVVSAIESAKVNIFEKVEIFDLYHGEQVPEGKKSMAYRITYRAKDKTLTDKEVDAAHNKIITALTEKLKIEIR